MNRSPHFHESGRFTGVMQKSRCSICNIYKNTFAQPDSQLAKIVKNAEIFL